MIEFISGLFIGGAIGVGLGYWLGSGTTQSCVAYGRNNVVVQSGGDCTLGSGAKCEFCGAGS